MEKDLKKIINKRIWSHLVLIFGIAFCSAYSGKIMAENFNYIDNFLIIVFIGILFMTSMIFCDVLKAIMIGDIKENDEGCRNVVKINTLYTVLETTFLLIYVYVLSRIVGSHINYIVELLPTGIFCIFASLIIAVSGIISYLSSKSKMH